MQRRRRFRKGSLGSYSTFSLLKKELREGHLQSLLGGSSYTVPPSNAAADPLLSSFISNLPVANSSKDVQFQTLDEGSSISKRFNNKIVGSAQPFVSEEDQEEKARRSEFVRELMLSTIFEETL
uniref:Protein DEHYDRATION-INDUCED 19 2 n=1 Tax=Anthurium amnicola TaxID=1678845 RepID=A0A1D1YNC0_9ARAE